MDKINPFRNSEKDELVNAVRAVLSGQKYEAPIEEAEVDPVDPKAVKKKFKDRKDKDIDNDGDVDGSDEYLHKRRKAISKAVAKEEVELDEGSNDSYYAMMDAKDKAKKDGKVWAQMGQAEKDRYIDREMRRAGYVKHGSRYVKEELRVFRVSDGRYGGNVHARDEKGAIAQAVKKGLNKNKLRVQDQGPVSKMARHSQTGKRMATVGGESVKEDTDDNPANRQHLCAKNVVHEEWGEGECISTMHADPDEDGHVAWYDVMFEHGIEAKVSIDELKVTKAEDHIHSSKKKNGKKDEVDTKPNTGEDRGTAE